MNALTHHTFSEREIVLFKKELLKFYDRRKRKLPWRDMAVSRTSLDERAYAVWVSEVMLQQTQVATVIDYYNLWMKKWPTVKELSQASLEDVKTLWSGLGYYSRAQRLHQGSQKVMEELNGIVPRSSKQLQKQLPGVGRYTAGAIASIAYNEVTGVVDGNVIRVLTRLRLIGADPSATTTNDLIWDLANKIVDEKRPGDFNQAMMELGATICTPKSPQCSSCPVQKICKVYARCQQKNNQTKIQARKNGKKEEESCSTVTDIEDVSGCAMCLPQNELWNASLGVMNYPRKPKKKKPDEKTYIAVLLEKKEQLYMTRRPENGLLAGMLEFPLIEVHNNMNEKEELKYCKHELSLKYGIERFRAIQFLGQISHTFSHLHHTYNAYEVLLSEDEDISLSLPEDENNCWMTNEQIERGAITTAIRKIMKLKKQGKKKPLNRRKRKLSDGQRSIDSMFKKACKSS